MKIIRLNIILIMLLTSLLGFSQKEGLNWHFGVNAGLKFHSGVPEPKTDGKLSTVEGCSSISSASGKLLLYTDGVTVYHRYHNVIVDGNNLKGSPDATQSGVIVPMPNDTNKFYIFTVSSLGVGQPQDGFRYTLVDVTLHNGVGGVVQGQKNVLLSPSTTERVTSVHHSNDYGIWVIMHEWESSRFRSYLVTTDGIHADDPVISEVGTYHGYHSTHNRDGIGYMKLSPDGRKIAVAIMGRNIVEVFDFDDVTGQIANPIELPVDTMPYGVEFSAGAEFLYATERKGDKVYQWSMTEETAQEIIDSREVVGILDNPFGGAMQMASDGKIYIARKSRFYLSVINYPYLPGQDCDFYEMGVDLGGKQSKEGLPTFVQSYFNNLWIIPENFCIDEEIQFCINSVINIDSIYWDFGDPDGVGNQLWGDSVSHNFSAPGFYTITAKAYHLITESVMSLTMEIIGLPDVELGSDRTICNYDTATIEAQPGFLTYKWNDGVESSSPFYYSSVEEQITIEVTNVCGIDFDTVNLWIQELPELELGNDTLIKYNTLIELDAGLHDQYLWHDSSFVNPYVTSLPGTFWVDVWDDLGCQSTDTIRIEPVPFKIYVPNAFTPNNDNLNDFFEVFTTYEISMDFEMLIFNRWGELVFETETLASFWDGTFNNEKCPAEVYTWIINASTFEDNVFFSGPTQISGTVTLIR